MGILDTLGEVAGAVAAVEGAEKLDPNAGLLTKGLAAVAGFKRPPTTASPEFRRQHMQKGRPSGGPFA